MIKFTVFGVPPSVNNYWLASGHRRYISKAGIQYKRDFALQAPSITYKLRKPVNLSIVWYRPDNRRRDCDNVLKAVMDCLTDTLLEDDSLIYMLSIDKSPKPDKKNPRIELAISLR